MQSLTDSLLSARGPRPSGRSPVPIPFKVHACEHCRTPFFVGELGPGTRIEIVCKRHGCKGYKVPVVFLVPSISAHDELRERVSNKPQMGPEVSHG
jgi:hypothetical protein